MPFDPKNLSPQARREYIDIGKQFGSSDTLSQADQTLRALKEHGAALTTFASSDKERLLEVRDLLSVAVEGRRSVQGSSKTTNKSYHDAIAAGKVAWLSGRTTLQNSRDELLESNDPEAANELRSLDTALEQTRSAEKGAEKLSGQLNILLGVLGNDTEGKPLKPLIAKAAEQRGGANAAKDLIKQASTLKEMAKQGSSGGTSTETEEIDLLDGIMVTLTRKARKAAREADKKAGTKSLSKEFELDQLYQSASKKKPTEVTAEKEAPKS